MVPIVQSGLWAWRYIFFNFFPLCCLFNFFSLIFLFTPSNNVPLLASSTQWILTYFQLIAGLQCSWTLLCSFIWYLRYVHTFSLFLHHEDAFTQLQLKFGFQIYCTGDLPLWCCVKSFNIYVIVAFFWKLSPANN